MSKQRVSVTFYSNDALFQNYITANVPTSVPSKALKDIISQCKEISSWNFRPYK